MPRQRQFPAISFEIMRGGTHFACRTDPKTDSITFTGRIPRAELSKLMQRFGAAAGPLMAMLQQPGGPLEARSALEPAPTTKIRKKLGSGKIRPGTMKDRLRKGRA